MWTEMKKKIVFLTGTRAEFGKMKPLIKAIQSLEMFDVHIFVTGMHLNSKYGKTIDEIYKSGFKNIYPFINHDRTDFMDRNLSKTIDGFSHYIAELKPDLIVVHGDRVEALAGAIVGSLNNILVAHIEGGEKSGTIDDLIRHAVTKLSHIHLVANDEARRRLMQLGELEETIFIIGSPDIDIMLSQSLPSIAKVKSYYDVPFDNYGILMFHPVTTEIDKWDIYTGVVVDAVLSSGKNYIVIYPNNDLGSDIILKEYNRFSDYENIKVYPSTRFEYFLVLLKNADFILGNSSAGIREAPYYGIPTINIGSRQQSRSVDDSVKHVDYKKNEILSALHDIKPERRDKEKESRFGEGKSAELFVALLGTEDLWKIDKQKKFQDRF
jgi:UDP-N-acetylglucosamine 2-epimerase (hydrolysing)